MKECPSCKAWCFDEMETCFGCLHRFGREEDTQASPSAQMADALSKSSLLGSVESRAGDSVTKVAEDKAGDIGMKIAVTEDGGIGAKDATFDKKNEVVPFARLEGMATPSETARPFEEDGTKAFSLRAGWTLRVEVPESGDGLVVRLERPLP